MLRFVVIFLRITTGSCIWIRTHRSCICRDRQSSVLTVSGMGHNLFLFSARVGEYQIVRRGFKATSSSVRSVLPWRSGNGPPGLFQGAGAEARRWSVRVISSAVF
jgi:hypothetical protein